MRCPCGSPRRWQTSSALTGEVNSSPSHSDGEGNRPKGGGAWSQSRKKKTDSRRDAKVSRFAATPFFPSSLRLPHRWMAEIAYGKERHLRVSACPPLPLSPARMPESTRPTPAASHTHLVIASVAKQPRASVNRPGLLRFARNDEDGACGMEYRRAPVIAPPPAPPATPRPAPPPASRATGARPARPIARRSHARPSPLRRH